MVLSWLLLMVLRNQPTNRSRKQQYAKKGKGNVLNLLMYRYEWDKITYVSLWMRQNYWCIVMIETKFSWRVLSHWCDAVQYGGSLPTFRMVLLSSSSEYMRLLWPPEVTRHCKSRYICTKSHGVISQKTEIFVLAALTASDRTWYYCKSDKKISFI
jgi:hypothetical protein